MRTKWKRFSNSLTKTKNKSKMKKIFKLDDNIMYQIYIFSERQEYKMSGNKNYKTKQQSAIMDCIKTNANGYVTVNDIWNYLKEHNYSVGQTTIYRHLDKMEEAGIVTRLKVEGQAGACYRYLNPQEKIEDGFYIKCEECGEVTRMECHHLEEIYRHIGDDHNFRINPKKTVFYGKCEKCQKSDK